MLLTESPRCLNSEIDEEPAALRSLGAERIEGGLELVDRVVHRVADHRQHDARNEQERPQGGGEHQERGLATDLRRLAESDGHVEHPEQAFGRRMGVTGGRAGGLVDDRLVDAQHLTPVAHESPSVVAELTVG